MSKYLWAAYFLSGFAFWVRGHQVNGWPDRWRGGFASTRNTDWCETLFIILPICLLVGGLLWVVNAFIALRDRIFKGGQNNAG